ncbi:MAG: acyltransferase [Rhodospirillales bacterium]|nr:acyltransferase [Rhodospirillales bacterium]
MLFNSIIFCLVFLPPVLLGYWTLQNFRVARLWFLLAASLVFYAYWDWRLAPLLVGSIVVNWLAIQTFFRFGRREVLVATIAVNLLCLAVFKYLGFFGSIVHDAIGASLSLPQLVLPLGISFFTFHHIIYLADLLAGKAPRYSFRDYALYIALFPQLIAGPLVRHSEIIHQFALHPARISWERCLAQGAALFVIGMAKKMLIADYLANWADHVFAASSAAHVSMLDAWTGVLAFTFEIYFDFSGYSDMAIGLAFMFGLQLPANFNAPYRAANIAEFWRRWHMTLSRFLRDYLYIPLGGNRLGIARQVAALLATMALGGLWHGAAWTFVVWGALHGIALSSRVLVREWTAHIPQPVGSAFTFLFVSIAWVFFRAPDLGTARHLLFSMTHYAHGGNRSVLPTLAISAAIAVIGPTSQQIVERRLPAWSGAVAGAAMAILLFKLSAVTPAPFIYFKF